MKQKTFEVGQTVYLATCLKPLDKFSILLHEYVVTNIFHDYDAENVLCRNNIEVCSKNTTNVNKIKVPQSCFFDTKEEAIKNAKLETSNRIQQRIKECEEEIIYQQELLEKAKKELEELRLSFPEEFLNEKN